MLCLSSFLFFSCDTILDLLGSSGGGSPSPSFTESEAVEAMKSALNIGAKKSSEQLSKIDAYYNNELLKILLPHEAGVILDAVDRIPNGKGLVEDVIKRLNRCAEEAAKEVVPIFSEAITGMTVQDGIGIVMGERNAATVYLEDKTRDKLMAAYREKMKDVLEKDLIGGVSANSAWETLTDAYNSVVNVGGGLGGAIIGGITGTDVKPVEVDLATYATGKALDGVFVKVAEEEGKIRDNPLDYAQNIIRKVFGAVKGILTN